MFEFTTTTHNPSIPATFLAKDLYFTLMWLKFNFSVAQNNFKLPKEFLRFGKKERKQC